jgi:hypothetical protein
MCSTVEFNFKLIRQKGLRNKEPLLIYCIKVSDIPVGVIAIICASRHVLTLTDFLSLYAYKTNQWHSASPDVAPR